MEDGNVPNKIYYVELFMTTMKIKNKFSDGHQSEIWKSRDGGGNSE